MIVSYEGRGSNAAEVVKIIRLFVFSSAERCLFVFLLSWFYLLRCHCGFYECVMMCGMALGVNTAKISGTCMIVFFCFFFACS